MIKYSDIELDFTLAPKTEADVFLDENVSVLNVQPTGPFVRNLKDEILAFDNDTVFHSLDEGVTWQSKKVLDSNSWSVQDTHAICLTRLGTVILSFLNIANLHFNWVKKTNLPTKNTRLDLCVMRSFDGGHTWQEPEIIQQGYCGATTSMIELSSGEVVLAAQNLDYINGRHFSLTYCSVDDGKNWQASNHLDIGGQGHHAGCYEGTLLELGNTELKNTELENNKLWYCIRTNHDFFWHAYSYDKGKTWLELTPGIQASSSPAMLTRLQSGKIMMVFNKLYKANENDASRVAGQFSEIAASWQREELSVCFSDDEAKSWSNPIVVASCKGAWLSYPYVFEQAENKIWITTMQSQLKICFDVEELILKYS